MPTVITIHHPNTRDRAIANRSTRSPLLLLKRMRWYSFIGMQKRVARTFPRIITVSECDRQDISRDSLRHSRIPQVQFSQDLAGDYHKHHATPLTIIPNGNK
jgi:hypothetical protein